MCALMTIEKIEMGRCKDVHEVSFTRMEEFCLMPVPVNFRACACSEICCSFTEESLHDTVSNIVSYDTSVVQPSDTIQVLSHPISFHAPNLERLKATKKEFNLKHPFSSVTIANGASNCQSCSEG